MNSASKTPHRDGAVVAALWLLTGDVARILDVSAETVRFWERIGRLPALKTERGIRIFNRDDVERLAHERQATEHAK